MADFVEQQWLDRTPQVGETVRLWSGSTGLPIGDPFVVGALDAFHRPVPLPLVGTPGTGILCGHHEAWELVAAAPEPDVDESGSRNLPEHLLTVAWLDQEISRIDDQAARAKLKAGEHEQAAARERATAEAYDRELDNLLATLHVLRPDSA